MKLLAWVCLVVGLLVPTGAQAGVLYRAGQENHTSLTQLLHGEISAGYLFSNIYLQDYTEQTSSSRLQGWDVRGLWSPLPWLSVGAEYARLGKVDLKQAWVDSYKQARLGALVKLTLSPNTNPRFYLLGGYGKSTSRLKFSKMFQPAEKSHTYWMGGIGVETNIYKPFFAAVEGTIYWHQSAVLHKYYQLSSRVETALRLRAGVRF